MTTEQIKNWQVRESAPIEFIQSLPEHPLLMQVLFNRGLRTSTQVEDFLRGTDALASNPFRLLDMAPAVNRILHAIRDGEVICVYGDFDADGVSATALLVSALQAAGGRVGPYIPDRVDEGYGLNSKAIETIARKAKLLITVDCGIRSVHEVAQAQAAGVDVIVTDHHSIGAQLPPALAVINPQRKDGQSTFAYLAGVGVAYRLAQGIMRAVAHERWGRLDTDQAAQIEDELLEYVALGTVADLVPLLGENRWLVQRGLARLNQTLRPGLEALIARADLRPGTVDATAISFRLAPRINAAGRLDHAGLAYRLLRTNDPMEAQRITAELEALNESRRTLTRAAEAEADRQLAGQLDDDPAVLVVRSPEIRSGIVGLVAGKLTDRFYRPAVVIEEGPEESRGSARSIPEFDIGLALDELSHMLVRHGGHGRAAGFTVQTSEIESLAEALKAIAGRELGDTQLLRPTLGIDADVPYDVLDWSLQEQFARLEPTGQANSAPLLLCRNLRVREARGVGEGGRHLRLIVDGGPSTAVVDAVAFGFGEWRSALPEHTQIDAVFHLEANEWQGRKRLQLNVQDLRLAGSPGV